LSPLPATLFRCEIHAINVVGRMDGGLMLPQTIFLPVPFAPSTSAPSVGSRRLPLEAGSPADPHELAICGISSPDEVLQGRRKQSTGCRVRQLDDPEKTTRGQRKARNDFDTRKENHADHHSGSWRLAISHANPSPLGDDRMGRCRRDASGGDIGMGIFERG